MKERISTPHDLVVHDRPMRRELSCGVLLFQNRPRRSVLLLVDGERLDLPKGHIKRGESELEEETHISRKLVRRCGWSRRPRANPGPRTPRRQLV